MKGANYAAKQVPHGNVPLHTLGIQCKSRVQKPSGLLQPRKLATTAALAMASAALRSNFLSGSIAARRRACRLRGRVIAPLLRRISTQLAFYQNQKGEHASIARKRRREAQGVSRAVELPARVQTSVGVDSRQSGLRCCVSDRYRCLSTRRWKHVACGWALRTQWTLAKSRDRFRAARAVLHPSS